MLVLGAYMRMLKSPKIARGGASMSADIMTEEIIHTVKDVAKILQVDPRTIRKMIADGEIEAFRVRGEYRIRQSALDAFIEEQGRKKK